MTHPTDPDILDAIFGPSIRDARRESRLESLAKAARQKPPIPQPDRETVYKPSPNGINLTENPRYHRGDQQ